MALKWRWTIAAGTAVLALLVWLLLGKPGMYAAQPITPETAAMQLLKQYPGEIIANAYSDGVYTLQLQTSMGIYDARIDGNNGAIIGLKLVRELAASDQAADDEAGVGPADGSQGSENTPGSEDAQGSEDIPDNAGTTNTEGSQGDTGTGSGVSNGNDGGQATGGTPSNNGNSGGSAKPPEQPSREEQVGSGNGSGAKPPRILSEREASELALAHVYGEVEEVDLRGSDTGVAYYLVEIDIEDGRDAVVQVNAITGAIMSVAWEQEDDDNQDDNDDDDDDEDDDNDGRKRQGRKK